MAAQTNPLQTNTALLDSSGVSRLRLLAALATVYVVWGSTYLAIKVGVGTLPPMLLGAARFLVAGGLLWAWTAWRGAARPTAAQWRAAAAAGVLMLVGGNGAVTWAEQRIDSGVAALLVATVPLWMSVLGWRWQGERLRAAAVAGLVLGFGGVALLVRPSSSGIDLLAAGVVLCGALAWAVGSLYARTAALHGDGLRSAAMQMLAAAGVFALLGLGGGEFGRLDPAGWSAASLWALAYLTLIGSVVAFTAYVWLLRAAVPSTVSTYAYVNPLIAVLLGAVLLAEPVTSPMIGATVLIVAGVALIVSARMRRRAGSAGAGLSTRREVTRRNARVGDKPPSDLPACA